MDIFPSLRIPDLSKGEPDVPSTSKLAKRLSATWKEEDFRFSAA